MHDHQKEVISLHLAFMSFQIDILGLVCDSGDPFNYLITKDTLSLGHINSHSRISIRVSTIQVNALGNLYLVLQNQKMTKHLLEPKVFELFEVVVTWCFSQLKTIYLYFGQGLRFWDNWSQLVSFIMEDYQNLLCKAFPSDHCPLHRESSKENYNQAHFSQVSD